MINICINYVKFISFFIGLFYVFRGGYIIRPRAVEFWQGQRDRLHDRIKFRKPKEGETPDGKLLHEGEDGWVYERLSP